MPRPFGLFALCAIAAAVATGWSDAAFARRSPASDTADPLHLARGIGIKRSQIESGRAVVDMLPTDGRDVAVFGIVQTSAGAPDLVVWSRAVEHLYQGRYVAAIHRFSAPPRLDDLAALTLDAEDLRDLRKCRPGDCGLKLSAFEIGRIRAAVATAGDAWEWAAQHAYREVLLARVQGYLVSGLSAAPPYFDREAPISPQSEYAELAARIGLEPPYGGRALPYFDAYPNGGATSVESFLYWSKETLGGGKPIVSLTHVAIFSGPTPYAEVAARQVYASHYLDASLSFTIIAGGGEAAPQYLVYVRRSRTDAFEGTFGWLIRRIVERRIRAEGPALLDGLRRKLEGSDPPQDSES